MSRKSLAYLAHACLLAPDRAYSRTHMNARRRRHYPDIVAGPYAAIKLHTVGNAKRDRSNRPV